MKTIPDIPVKYKRFPDGYINDIHGWGFDRNTIEANKGKLLTLDIDYGSYCSLNCPACFRKNNSVDQTAHELKFDDLTKLILEAKELGLRSVKFLGAGEPFENADFLHFLHFLRDNDVIPLIFTKGQVLGDDEAVARYFGDHGITTGEQLAKELASCNASIMLGFNSFDDIVQAKMVGGKPEYVHIRNRALHLLVEAGFSDSNPTRLALAANPITNLNVDEVFEIYKWGRERNLYVVATPTMISGRAKKSTWEAVTPSREKLVELYANIYKFNLETNLQTMETIKAEGISAYAGGHPCNQVATGLYVTLNGIVLSCPGSELNVEGNLWQKSLRDIWLESQNYKRAGTFNCECIAKDGKSIPKRFYNDVMNKLLDLPYSDPLSVSLRGREQKESFETLLNHFVEDFCLNWSSRNNNKRVRISIQLGEQVQGRNLVACSAGTENLTVNAYCNQVIKSGESGIAACNQFDTALKVMYANIKPSQAVKGFLCKCHAQVSNVFFPHMMNDGQTWYLFFGQFLLVVHPNSDGAILAASNSLRGNQIAIIEKVPPAYKAHIYPHAVVAEEGHEQYVKQTNISRITVSEFITCYQEFIAAFDKFIDEVSKDEAKSKLLDAWKDSLLKAPLLKEHCKNLFATVKKHPELSAESKKKITDWLSEFDIAADAARTGQTIDMGKYLKLAECGTEGNLASDAWQHEMNNILSASTTENSSDMEKRLQFTFLTERYPWKLFAWLGASSLRTMLSVMTVGLLGYANSINPIFEMPFGWFFLFTASASYFVSQLASLVKKLENTENSYKNALGVNRRDLYMANEFKATVSIRLIIHIVLALICSACFFALSIWTK